MTSVSKVANIRIGKSPTFPARKGFGLLNIVGISQRLPVGNRIRFYSTIDAVAADFSSTDEEYKAAQVFFSQKPKPVELAISRRFNVAVPGELLCSVNYQKTLATWQAIADGAFKINIDGGAVEEVTGVNLTGAANMNAIATLIQTRLQVVSANATCTFDGTRFIFRSGTTGVTSTVDYTTAPALGTDLGPLLGSRAADLGVKTAGAAAETIAGSLSALQNINPSWYGVALTKEATEQDMKDAAAWTEARVKLFAYTTSASNVQDSAAIDDLATFFKTNLYERTFGVWDDNDAYSAISAVARAFTVNFNEKDSTITLKFKQLPGTTPANLTDTQIQALESKNINYYTYFGDSAMLAEGKMASGSFFDEVHGLDWLQNAIETNVFGYLYTRTTKVPQTDKGLAALVQQTNKGFEDGINNGLLAPGIWNGADLGEVKSGSYLSKGYYTYAQPVAEQNQSDREARKAPPIKAIAKGAGALHSVDIGITFER